MPDRYQDTRRYGPFLWLSIGFTGLCETRRETRGTVCKCLQIPKNRSKRNAQTPSQQFDIAEAWLLLTGFHQ